MPEKDGFFPDNHLLIEQKINEAGQVSRTYKNMRGLVVLNRVGDGTIWFDTYYLYSPSGLLTLVIQPEGVARLASEFDAVGANKQSFVNRWCFQYQYDDEQRMIAKRIPGWTDWAYTVYDRWNRVVLTQTPAQRARNEYSFNKYDRFNRAIMTGLWVTTTPLATLRTNAANSTVRFETEVNNADGYTLTSTYPTAISSADLRSISYYDNYSFLTYTGWDADGPNSNYNFVNLAGFPQNTALLTSVKGHATGSKTRVLGQTRWLNSVTHYDTKYRSVQTISENYVGGRDRVTTLHDFTGRNLKTQHHHTASASTYTCLREFDYDHMGRVLRTWQTTDAGPRILLSSQAYNEIGQLVEKNLHSEDNGLNFLQSVDMRYNIRGWLTSINNSSLTNDGSRNNDGNDLFGMELLYNPASPPAISGYPTAGNLVPKLYDGNITAIKWKTDTKEPGVTPQERIYGFDYDVLSRLEKAHYAVDNAGAWTGDAGMFNEAVKSYDRNGNIQGIERQARVNGISIPIDNTTYGYNYSGVVPNFNGVSNRLLAVSDAANARGFKDASAQVTEEYRYDASGNLIFDHNKSISNVVYNFLNLPEVIEFTRPNTTIDRIEYTYDAVGNKLRQVVKINGTQVWKSDYVGDLQYDNDQLVLASTPEGRVVKNSSGWDYEYFHKDHQGNVRLTYGKLKETLSYRATLENPPGSTLGTTEENTFRNINTTRHTDPALNYTRSSDQVLVPDKSAKVNGFEGRPIGPAKSLQLGAGDKVKMEVFARYSQVTGSTATIAANVLVAAVATTTFGFAPGETGFNSFNSNAPVVPGIGGASATVPKAYLAYLFFDQNFVFITSGAVSITTAAFNAFERLERTFTAPQAGYLYVYVANESNTGASAGAVYFDEMLLVHQKNNSTLQVTQASDYYPFGLAFNIYQAERVSEAFANVPKNRYGFQGQEWQSDLDLGWSQFKWRMHDPALGRFGAVDPLSDKYPFWSPYSFSGNILLSAVELEGLEPESPPYMWKHAQTYNHGTMFSAEGYWVFRSSDNLNNNKYQYLNGSSWVDFVPNSPKQLAPQLAKGLYAVYAVGGGVALAANAGAAAWVTREGIESAAEELSGIPILPIFADPTDVFDPAINRALFRKGLSQGDDIALGVRESLGSFSEKIKAKTWEVWGTDDFKNQFLQTIKNPSNRIHFNLDGIPDVWKAVNDGVKGFGKSDYVTSWELYQVYSNPDVLKRTFFYRNGQIVESPF
ncbi:MAG: hypothetical protein JNL17_07225 [Cyclobacteriaceae bacterium]|nr:hypothetical protein [Cyclobacteriaceae bacterium]